uniref:Uncharacterized protein n=1 Tax=Meloidogyne incognita TaxID=6306 RepID=A0A914LLN0_MELIC
MGEKGKTCGQTFADMWRYNAIVPKIFYCSSVNRQKSQRTFERVKKNSVNSVLFLQYFKFRY